VISIRDFVFCCGVSGVPVLILNRLNPIFGILFKRLYTSCHYADIISEFFKCVMDKGVFTEKLNRIFRGK
jgi:hypothetical protein